MSQAVRVFLILCLFLQPLESGFACFTIVVGKKASKDGAVIFGHNEDDGGRRVVNAWLVPRMTHQENEWIVLTHGGTVPQVRETWSYLWFQMNDLSFSDYYMNEWGVTIASDACDSREDRPELTDGGIGYYLRRIVAERARTAREGTRIAGDLLDHFGYASSGRTLVICDPQEGWLLSIVAGKHWVAQRVPDDAVVILPNVYVVRGVDFNNTNDFMFSKSDIREYARRRGWYSGNDKAPFDFAAVFSPPPGKESKAARRGYDTRQWQGQRLVTGIEVTTKEAQDHGLPFAVIPNRKLDARDVMAVLRDHYEGTVYSPQDMRALFRKMKADETGAWPSGFAVNPNMTTERTICTSTTQFSTVAQLRAGLPPALGCVLWTSYGRPDCHAFVPWYLGLGRIPSSFTRFPGVNDPLMALKYHFEKVPGVFEYDFHAAYWIFNDLENLVDGFYPQAIDEVKKEWNAFEEELAAFQKSVEETASALMTENAEAGRAYLTQYTESVCSRQIEQVKSMTQRLKTKFYR